MKKFPLILLLLTLFFTGCVAQDLPGEPPLDVSANFKVLSISGDQATLYNREYAKTFKVDKLTLKESWEYFFILEIEKCDRCQVRNATVLFFEITAAQAEKNIREGVRLHKIANPKDLQE